MIYSLSLSLSLSLRKIQSKRADTSLKGSRKGGIRIIPVRPNTLVTLTSLTGIFPASITEEAEGMRMRLERWGVGVVSGGGVVDFDI